MVSFAFFFANGQALQLEHPAKGDVWPAFTKQRIEWRIANVDNIKIEISTDSARTWAVLQSSYPASAGNYEWTVINKPSDSCFVRITDVANPSVSSTNYPGNPFIIPKPTITVDNIVGNVFGKMAVPITWVSSGIQAVRILGSYNNGVTYNVIAVNIPADKGYYNWIAKDTNAINCFIAIQSANDNSVMDQLDQKFSIKQLPTAATGKYKGGSYDGHSSATNKAKDIKLLTPNTNVLLTANTGFSIRWNSTSVNLVDIKYSINNGSTWTDIVKGFSSALSAYNWNVPATPSTSCLVKIQDASDTTLFDVSDDAFSIKSNNIRLVSPLEKEVGYRGQAMPVEWTSEGFSKIKISYNDGTTWKTIKETDAGAGVFNWVVPGNISGLINLKISNLSDESQYDTISGIIIKTAPELSAVKYRGGSYDGHSSGTNITPSLTITSPNSNIQIPSAIKYNISWASMGIGKVDIAFSSDGGKNWSPVASSYPNTGSYSWSVPAIASTNCLIKIKDSNDSTLSDVSDVAFTILPKTIRLVIDTISKKYYGAAFPLEWSHVSVNKISLHFKTAVAGNWQTIKEAVPAEFEQHNWITPSFASDSLWLRVSDAENSLVNDEKMLVSKFTNLPASLITKYRGGSFDGHSFRSTNNKISIAKPAANDTLLSGSQFTITWNSGNVTDSVSLQYSSDSGRTWKVITTTGALNNNYSWVVPSELSRRTASGIGGRTSSDILSDKCMVRAVQLNSDNEVVGISNKTFTIIQSLTLPVTIVSFKANYVNEKAELRWVTENELNLKQYEVERSFDGVDFRKVGQVAATGQKDYIYADKLESITVQELFYRLKKVDKDNRISYSAVVALHVPDKTSFKIYPNPAKTFIAISIGPNVSGLIQIELTNILGKVVHRKTIQSATSVVKLNTTGFSPGIYLVKIVNNNKKFIRRIIVAK